MIYVIFLLSLLLFSNFQFQVNGVVDGYIDKLECNVIKGVFIVFVFLSHFLGYVHLNNPMDVPYISLQKYLGQFIVAMFLFYSGYGIMVSLMRKGNVYLNRIPVHRILRTLIHFDLAVLIYLIVWTGLHGEMPEMSRILSSLLAWGSIGNSNWYIFVIMVLWIATFFGFKICGVKNIKESLLVTLVLTVASSLVIMYFRYSEHWWYDTMLCYPLGMYFAVYKSKVEKFLFSCGHDIFYWVTFSLFVILVVLFGKHKGNYVLYEAWMLSLTIFTLLITMKFRFNSKILAWLGRHLFEIYILMRLPMMILKPYFNGHNYRYLIICAFLTWIISLVFTDFLKFFDSKIFKLE